MTERNYKNLNIERENVDGLIRQFAENSNLHIESIHPLPGGKNGVRVIFGSPGTPFAMVNIYFNKDGTSTVQHSTGSNHELGKLLSDFLYDSINPAEFERVNMVLEGFNEGILTPVLELTTQESHIDLLIHSQDEAKVIWKLNSRVHQDELTVTIHKTTRRLQIQGRPLSCYRAFIFNLSELLDLRGLEQVLIRQEDGKAEIVQQEVARTYLTAVLGDSYQFLHRSVEKLLISGLCVKLAAPELPDYSMLLYPELRSIEGILKELMATFKMPIPKEGFGDFFDKNGVSFFLKPEYIANCPKYEIATIISNAYTFFNKERHGLFHMQEIVDASRLVGDISHVMTKSTQAWEHIKSLYSIKNV